MTDVTFIIVNYRQGRLLADCLKTLVRHTKDVGYEVIVVDNYPDDIWLTRLRRAFPEVKFVENSINVGFGAANNVGARIARGRYFFFLNPDIVFKSNSAATLVRFLDDRPDVDGAGCRLENADGSLQFSIRRYPTVVNQLAEALFLHHLWRRSRWTGIVSRDPDRYATERPVEWLTGAALMVRRSAFEALGGFDEAFFLYSEEEDLCYRLKKAGGQLYYVPETTLIHIGGESGQKPQLLAQLTASKILFFAKNRSRASGPALRAALALRLLVRYLAALALAVLKRGNRRAASRSAYYRAGLAVALTRDPATRQVADE